MTIRQRSSTRLGPLSHTRGGGGALFLYLVKDAWRNPTMHPRKTGYNDLETLNLPNQLRSFMNELASVIPARVAMNKASSVPTPSIATLPSA